MKKNRSALTTNSVPIYLLIIILIGLILRIYNLGKFGFWYDEAISFLTSDQLEFPIPYYCQIPPLGNTFLILLKGWMGFASNDSFLRFFSVIWGILSITMIYQLGEFIFSKRIGILSALLLSVSPLHIYYSQELTCYSL
jgi:uncharacterized membrane protein